MSTDTAPSILNPAKALLRAGKPIVGIAITMPSVELTQILAAAGFDWLLIDMEHGPIDLASLHAMIAATGGTRTAPVVRVPWNIPWLIKPVLDAGAMGIVFPMIRSRADAEQAVAAVRYPPAGERGWGPFYAPYRWGVTTSEYCRRADDELLIMVLIEHPDAVRDIDAIASVPGLDVLTIAPYDLSVTLGLSGGPQDPGLAPITAKLERAILAQGAHLGGVALTGDQANAMIDRGYRVLGAGYDALLIDRAANEILSRIRR